MDIFDRHYVFESKEDQFCFAGHEGDKSPEYDIIFSYIGSDSLFQATLRAEKLNIQNGFTDIVAILEKRKNKYNLIEAISKEGELTKEELYIAIDNPSLKIFTATRNLL